MSTVTPASVLYCSACGVPPEYCEYGPDYETHCMPWLAKHHHELLKEIGLEGGGVNAEAGAGSEGEASGGQKAR